ncbi:MAG: DUF4399 domain-containing protein, partial [Halioglobus sp.]|nr:DUF4399 domain-containing protein [Halioglobus sp.]
LLAFLAGTGACNSNNGQEQGVQNKASASTASSVAMLPRSMAPQGAHLYFKEPKDGATVTSPVHIEFGLDGMDVVAAGTQAPMSGHHHVIIDSDLPPFDMPIPADDHHVHFGDGRIATDLELTPGNHSLQLLLGDHLHIPHQPPVYSERITITVE